jgi:proline dehydrogenase
LCLENHTRVSVCIGTHNEESSLLGTQIQAENNIASNSSHVFYSQLLGMSDHISYNLAHAKYNVCKYVPYGPVSAVIPYLTRRAQENSGMAGQMGRELSLINSEIIRRKS